MKCPDCDGELGGYEDPYVYDGVCEWRCLSCSYRRGRWSGRRLEGAERETSADRYEANVRAAKSSEHHASQAPD